MMPLMVADCPRCRSSKITFDVQGAAFVGLRFDWQYRYEVFSVCRHCRLSTVFTLRLSDASYSAIFCEPNRLLGHAGSINDFFYVDDYVSLKNEAGVSPPDHVPTEVAAAFREGATCLVVNCPNAASAMFRLCVDLATRPLLPSENDDSGPQPNLKQRRDLGLRLPWLFANGRLPEVLHDLASCIKDDGNDGVHSGNLGNTEAEDLLDFTTQLLQRLYTDPENLRLARERTAARRQGKT